MDGCLRDCGHFVGDNLPVFLRFRGGKGIATMVGVTATCFFGATLVSGILAILFIVITRYVSLGSLFWPSLSRS